MHSHLTFISFVIRRWTRRLDGRDAALEEVRHSQRPLDCEWSKREPSTAPVLLAQNSNMGRESRNTGKLVVVTYPTGNLLQVSGPKKLSQGVNPIWDMR